MKPLRNRSSQKSSALFCNMWRNYMNGDGVGPGHAITTTSGVSSVPIKIN